MDLLLLNSELLNDMIVSNGLGVMIKPQKGKKGLNYFFIPNIGIKLFNVKVSWIDPFKKNISFSINRWENPHLISLLRHINTILSNIYIKNSYSDISVSPFFF